MLAASASPCRVDAAGSVGRDAIEQDVIVDAAIDIIVRNGLAGLTLRPLAASLGVSVAAVSARMGTKEQLVDRVIDVAAQRDQRFFERWASFAVQVAPSDAAARAAVALAAPERRLVRRSSRPRLQQAGAAPALVLRRTPVA